MGRLSRYVRKHIAEACDIHANYRLVAFLSGIVGVI